MEREKIWNLFNYEEKIDKCSKGFNVALEHNSPKNMYFRP